MLEQDKYEILLDKVLDEKSKGKSQEDMLLFLKENTVFNVSVMDAIKMVSEVYHLPLDESKEIVYESGAWKETVQRYEEFHNKLTKSLEDF